MKRGYDNNIWNYTAVIILRALRKILNFIIVKPLKYIVAKIRDYGDNTHSKDGIYDDLHTSPFENADFEGLEDLDYDEPAWLIRQLLNPMPHAIKIYGLPGGAYGDVINLFKLSRDPEPTAHFVVANNDVFSKTYKRKLKRDINNEWYFELGKQRYYIPEDKLKFTIDEEVKR